MACEGWDDGETCMLEVNIAGKTIVLKGVVRRTRGQPPTTDKDEQNKPAGY